MKIRYSYLTEQFADCDDLWLQLKEFVKTGDFTLGKPLQEFEANFANLIGTKYNFKSLKHPKILILFN